MNKIRYLAIPLIVITFVFSGCAKTDDGHSMVEQKEYWTCTMHPQVQSDRPGACPICGMDLIKKSINENGTDTVDDMTDMITLSKNKQVLANVGTVTVKKEQLKEEVTAYSYMDFVESSRKTISARFNGRIEKLFVDKTGDYIKSGQPLFEIYSPDLVQAQNDYLIALNSQSNSDPLVTASRKKLEIFGMTAGQIKALEKSREPDLTTTYFSPINGTVIEKKVQEGVYVNEGTVIYEIAELSTLWNIAEVYENNLSAIKVGSPVKLSLRAYPGEEFNGRVSFIYPVVNSQSRTVKVRSDFQNYNGRIKPQMYGETVFSKSGGEGLLVPADAIIMAGRRSVVWVKTGDKTFEAHEVKIGNRFKDKYRVISGLKEGDEIAASGGFLIDSESQLKTGMSSSHQHSEIESSVKSIQVSPQKSESPKAEIKKGNPEKLTAESIVRSGSIDLKAIDKNKDGKVFQDPMDWNVISDDPGRCPLCNMKLKEVSLEEASKNLIENGFKTK